MVHTLTWVVVANGAKAKIYRMDPFPKLNLLHELKHPESRLMNHEIAGDKPGRSFDSLGMGRHAYQAPHSPKELEMDKFAKEVSEKLYGDFLKGAFQRFYLIADPSFLGRLRQCMSPKLKEVIISEVAKDLNESSLKEIEKEITSL